MLRFYKQGKRLINLALIVKITPHDADDMDYTHIVMISNLEFTVDAPYDQFEEFLRFVQKFPEGVYKYHRGANAIYQVE